MPMCKSLLTSYYPEADFGGFSDVDGTVKFYTRIHALLCPSSVVLDAGCGRGSWGDDLSRFQGSLRNLKGKCRKLVGIDVDRSASDHPFLDEFHLIRDDRWPLESETFDLCVSDYVLEHVPTPDAYFAEAARVLKPRGILCLRTPNAWSYEALAARLIPNHWHRRVVRSVQNDRAEIDVFPTCYRCNTARRLRSMLRRHGFEGTVMTYSSEPGYLTFSKIAYALGVVWHRYAPRALRSNLVVFARKLPRHEESMT